MKRGEIIRLGFIIAVAALISYFIAGILFNPPDKRGTKVPTIEKINTVLPDVKNETSYQSFLNQNALDARATVRVAL